MTKKIYQVTVMTAPNDLPKPHELRAATILANRYFKKDIIFLRRVHGKTPDIDVGNNILWEIKSPEGNSKNTIANNLKTASKQSRRIVLDLSRCKMHQDRVFI